MSIKRVERKHRGVGYRVYLRDDRGRQLTRTFDQMRDARAFEAQARVMKQSGTISQLDAGNETLNEFVVEWFQNYAKPNLAAKTLSSYAGLLDRHILPRLGEMRLREIKPRVIDGLMAEMKRDGVGIESIRKSLAVLQTCLQRAVVYERIPSNPVAAIRKPSQRRSRVVEPPPPRIVEAIREAMLKSGSLRDATFVSVLAYAGLRPGEAIALRWADVRERTLLVSKRASLGEILEGAKSQPRSVRSVELLPALKRDLAQWSLANGRPDGRALVFPNAHGEPWTEHDYKNWNRRSFKPAALVAGLEHSRPYDLRHAFASLLLAEGRSVVEVADQLGHAPSLTLDTYAHVMRELGREQGENAASLIARARESLATTAT